LGKGWEHGEDRKGNGERGKAVENKGREGEGV